MKLDSEIYKDKLGREVLLRSAKPCDAEMLIKYLIDTTSETRFLVREPEEITFTKEGEINFINANESSDRELLMTCFVDGEFAGNASVMTVGPASRYRHRCSVAIAIYKKFWGYGIGSIMFERILRAAKDMGYEQAELEVMKQNKLGQALYEKYGFKVYGTFPNNMKYKDGTYDDSLFMVKNDL